MERWRLSSAKGEYAAAGVVDGNIILGTDIVGEVISVSQMDGRVNWTFAPGSRGFRAPPAIVGDMVYVADKEGSFYALDAVTGQEIWRLQLDGWVDYDPAITDGVIYIGTMAGSVYALGDGGTELPAATPAAGRATPSAPLWTESGRTIGRIPRQPGSKSRSGDRGSRHGAALGNGWRRWRSGRPGKRLRDRLVPKPAGQAPPAAIPRDAGALNLRSTTCQ